MFAPMEVMTDSTYSLGRLCAYEAVIAIHDRTNRMAQARATVRRLSHSLLYKLQRTDLLKTICATIIFFGHTCAVACHLPLSIPLILWGMLVSCWNIAYA